MKVKLVDEKSGMQSLKLYTDNDEFLANGGITGKVYDKHLWFDAVIVGLTLKADGTIVLHEGKIINKIIDDPNHPKRI